jgi:hypothetical protein
LKWTNVLVSAFCIAFLWTCIIWTKISMFVWTSVHVQCYISWCACCVLVAYKTKQQNQRDQSLTWYSVTYWDISGFNLFTIERRMFTFTCLYIGAVSCRWIGPISFYFIWFVWFVWICVFLSKCNIRIGNTANNAKNVKRILLDLVKTNGIFFLQSILG